MASIGMNCIKYLLFLFNLIFAVTGIVLICVGVMIQQMYNNYSAFIDEKLFTAPVVFMSVGVFIFVVAFCGCCGAMWDNNKMLTVFSFLLCLIFIFEIAGGAAGYLLKDDLGRMLETRMNSSLKSYNTNLYYLKTWNVLQFDLSCCGVRSRDDWTVVFPNGSLPHSCCPNLALDEHCISDQASPTGCLPTLMNLIQHNTTLIIAFGISVAIIQLIAVLFACCLSHSIRQYETV